MSDQRNFTAADCNFWNYQMCRLYENSYAESLYPGDQQYDQDDNWYYPKNNEIVVAPAVSVGCSVVLMGAFSMQTVLMKQKFGFSHIILFLWTILQAPQLPYLLHFPERLTEENKI